MASGKYLTGFGIFTIALVMTGCYTELMTIQEFSQSRREKPAVRSDASYSLNYNQNCVTCHSVAELDDRYLELKYYNVASVHGMTLDPNRWSGYVDVPFGGDIYYPRPIDIFQPIPWWLPPATIVSDGSTTVTVPTKNRPRTAGTTREGTRERDPIPSVQGTTQPTQSTGTTAATPPPATTVAPSSTSSQPSTTTERPRTETNDSSGNKTRSEGATRDNGNRPR